MSSVIFTMVQSSVGVGEERAGRIIAAPHLA
jgi:hypothetical protein